MVRCWKADCGKRNDEREAGIPGQVVDSGIHHSVDRIGLLQRQRPPHGRTSPPASPPPTATSTPTEAPTPTRTVTPMPIEAPTLTPTPVPTLTQAPTLTPTPAPMWVQVAARLPQESGQPFELIITGDELTQLAIEEAAESIEVNYERLTVEIHADSIAVTAHASLLGVPRGIDIAAEGIPVIKDGQVRFEIVCLNLLDAYQQLTEFVTLVVTNTLNRTLYFLQPVREAHIRAVSFKATHVRLMEGAMVIEGVSD